MRYHLFTPTLYRFLQAEGFTHIHGRGVVHGLSVEPTDPDQDAYVLVPLREDITLRFEETAMWVEAIDSLDVQEMLEYTPGIDFWVELPDDVTLRFEKWSS